MIVRRIRKFQETGAFGEPTGRIIYAADPTTIPASQPDTTWKEDHDFDEEADIQKHPGLQPVFDYAREHGHAVIEPAD